MLSDAVEQRFVDTLQCTVKAVKLQSCTVQPPRPGGGPEMVGYHLRPIN